MDRAADHAATPRSVLGRAALILDAFDLQHQKLSLAGLVARTRLPRTTAYRTAEQMVQLGWLGKYEGRYLIGLRLFELAGLALIRTCLREAALPFLQDLYETTHETAHLVVLEDTEVVYVEKISGHRKVTDLSWVGGRLPAYCTGVGKVLLAHSPAEQVDRVIAQGLAARTSATIVSAVRLRKELESIRQGGVGFDREECDAGMVCVAAPILYRGQTIAALSVTGPAGSVQLHQLEGTVRTAALGASRALTTSAKPWEHLVKHEGTDDLGP